MTISHGETDSGFWSDSLIRFHPLQTACRLPLSFPWRCELPRDGRRTAAVGGQQCGSETRILHSTANAACNNLRRGRGGQVDAVHLCFCHREQTGATVWVCVSVRGIRNTHTNTHQGGYAREHKRTHAQTGSCTQARADSTGIIRNIWDHLQREHELWWEPDALLGFTENTGTPIYEGPLLAPHAPREVCVSLTLCTCVCLCMCVLTILTDLMQICNTNAIGVASSILYQSVL